MHLRFRRAFGDAQQAGDLMMRKAFHIVQHEREAAPFRQAGNGPLEIDAADGRREAGRC